METTEYALGRTPAEYERVRAQARLWEPDTARLLDRLGVGAGARCLDAGCGPGETMRRLAERVGPTGEVTGIDLDPGMAAAAESYTGCRVLRHDVTKDEPLPGGPYDLVYARLLLFHTPDREAALARLWAAVAPGGHLLVQDYDMRTAGVVPSLGIVERMTGLVIEAFGAAGCDVRAGSRLPYLMARAGVGAPDGTDVAGRLVPMAVGTPVLESVFRSLLPVAVANGLITRAEAERSIEALHAEAAAHPDRSVLLPLLNGAWKRR
ncbi:methyltransferase domain-containing protein [Actinoplanes oblitus]|uniref:Methyltransferase domain-containing protein n=1 Tax=Actinoplanes oblitus TaxID=3040509 RepID=A0ABY8W8F2_9ACTN|nr:class I SAM-dependent methyltransferase [Actinoplanes oblitus]WIM93391.1 methyltransferase domain-containing protein [Actinoplanes oblitus]